MDVISDMQEFLMASSEIARTENENERVVDGRDPKSTGFDELWRQLGGLVRMYPYMDPIAPTSFGKLTLRDVLAALPQGVVTTDESNFWVTPTLPLVKLTTYDSMGGEEGFMRSAAKACTDLVFVAMEYKGGFVPRIITCGQCRCFVIPEIINPHAFVFLLTTAFGNGGGGGGGGNNSNGYATTTTTTGGFILNNTTSPFTLGGSGGVGDDPVDVHHLLTRWKSEKPGQKPTIPKLADFANVDPEKLKKAVNKGQKPWMQLLADHGFRGIP
jgi:hypothetical protein